LITFAGDTSVLFEKPVPATQANLEKAQAFLDSRQGGGGTEMMTAIKTALEPSDSQDHLRIVCFMTDGYVGNEGEIISEIQKHKNARVFSFGIGSSVNRFLLDKMAEEGNGEVEYVSLSDDGTKAAKKFYERVRTPLLTDISIDWNGLPVADVYPNRISDLFSAKPVILHGRYTKAASGTIKLKGKIAGQDYVREISVNLPETENANDVLATLWARTRIDELTKKDYSGVQNGNADAEIRQTITNLGLEYRLLTQFTSFVAVEERIVNQNGQPIRVDVPVNIPEGVNPETTISDSADAAISPIRVSNAPIGKGRVVALKSASGVGYGSSSGSSLPPVPRAIPKSISGGVINGRATNLPKPAYPASARAVNASGAVSIQVTIDESGNVISATAVSGHPLLQQAAVKAARTAKFSPTMMSGQPVKVTGIVTYNFQNPANSGNINVSVGNMSESDGSELQTKPLTAEELREKNLKEKLHFWIYEIVRRLAENKQKATANEGKFVKNGKAEIQISVKEKSAEVLEKLKTLGFEVSSAQSKDRIVGKISIEKLADLAEIAEIQYVLPKLD
nr:TonB family protein [Pyrinomonadaceae bacterium]